MNRAAPSIRRSLLLALISTLLIVWLVVLVLVYRVAEHEVEEVFDADLARSARTMQALLMHEVDEEQQMSEKVRDVVDELGSEGLARYPRLAAILRGLREEESGERQELVKLAEEMGHRYESGLIFAARYGDGSVMLRDAAGPELPMTDDGHVNISLGGTSWRVFRLTDPHSGFTVQVGERQGFRSELVRYITRNTVMPLLVALPILALLIWFVVGRVLAPLQRVAEAVSRRAPNALDEIDEGNAPREIHSLVQALNALFSRVRATLGRERQFTADAAHELRTPLAALKAHLQVAQKDAADAKTRLSIEQALQGVDRATHTVEQLLLLARADADQTRDMVAGEVDLRELAIEGVALLSQMAFERDIDLGVDAPRATITRGDRSALLVMLRNLVDNAVRYTPEGGTVTAAVGRDGDRAWVSVRDTGPGIAQDEHERVFKRFHRGNDEKAARTTGSGLGLAIVQRIVHLHEASVELGPGIDDTGLGVTVRFPPVV